MVEYGRYGRDNEFDDETPEERIARLEDEALYQQRKREENAFSIDLDPSQTGGIEETIRWYGDDSRPNMFKMVGPAGSGKTSLILPLIKRLSLPLYTCRELQGGVRVMAYTNRAARVLVGKGIGARTIHSFAGHPPPEIPDDPLIQKMYKELQEALVAAQDKSSGERRQAEIALDQFLTKYRNRDEDKEFPLDPHSILERTRLVIADEMSMLNKEQGELIKNQCRKLLILGDPLQLGPPTREGSYFFPDGCTWDYELKQIHRQGAGRLADFLKDFRASKNVRFIRFLQDLTTYRPDVWIYKGERPHDAVLKNCDVTIARTHDAVWELNQRIRQTRDITSPHPVVGERLISLYQNVKRGLWKNDFVHFVDEPKHDGNNNFIEGKIETDDGHKIGMREAVRAGIHPTTTALPEYFTLHPGKKAKFEWSKMEGGAKLHEVMVFDNDGVPLVIPQKRWTGTVKLAFGHAITVYQSQGGEWDNVCAVFRSFWNSRMSEADQLQANDSDFRALYTMASRARKKLIIYM